VAELLADATGAWGRDPLIQQESAESA